MMFIKYKKQAASSIIFLYLLVCKLFICLHI